MVKKLIINKTKKQRKKLGKKPVALKKETVLKSKISSPNNSTLNKKKVIDGNIPLRKIWQAFINSADLALNDLIVKRNHKYFNEFISWVKTHYPEVTVISEITNYIAHEYNDCLYSGDKPRIETINNKIEVFKQVFEKLVGPGNPFSAVMTLKPEKRKSIKKLPWDKVCEICNNAGNWELQTLILIGMYTGMKLRHCCLLRWEDIDLLKGQILITKNKITGEQITPLKNHICNDLKICLEDIPVKARKSYVLPEISMKYIKRPDSINQLIHNLYRKCGIEPFVSGKKPGGKKKLFAQYNFKSFRLSYVGMGKDGDKTLEK